VVNINIAKCPHNAWLKGQGILFHCVSKACTHLLDTLSKTFVVYPLVSFSTACTVGTELLCTFCSPQDTSNNSFTITQWRICQWNTNFRSAWSILVGENSSICIVIIIIKNLFCYTHLFNTKCIHKYIIYRYPTNWHGVSSTLAHFDIFSVKNKGNVITCLKKRSTGKQLKWMILKVLE